MPPPGRSSPTAARWRDDHHEVLAESEDEVRRIGRCGSTRVGEQYAVHAPDGRSSAVIQRVFAKAKGATRDQGRPAAPTRNEIELQKNRAQIRQLERTPEREHVKGCEDPPCRTCRCGLHSAKFPPSRQAASQRRVIAGRTSPSRNAADLTATMTLLGASTPGANEVRTMSGWLTGPH